MLNRLERMLLAAEVAAEEAVLLAVDAEPVTLDRRLDAALLAALEAAVLAREERSTFARDVRLLRTDEELLLFTRFLEPEISPLRKDFVLLFVWLPSPLMLDARVRRLLMLAALLRSSLPADL